MPQTTTSVALACGFLEIATDLNCAGWVDISGSSSVVEQPEQTRISGEGYTFDGDNALVEGGKKEPMDIVVKITYTETAGEAFEIAMAATPAMRCTPRPGESSPASCTRIWTLPPVDRSWPASH
jgi:hypothetical protein